MVSIKPVPLVSMFLALSCYLTGRLVWAASLDMIHTCSSAGQESAVKIPSGSRMLPFETFVDFFWVYLGLHFLCLPGIEPGVAGYAAALDGCCHGSEWSLALSLGLIMDQHRVAPHAMSQSLLLSECEQQGLQHAELDLLATLSRLTSDPHTANPPLGSEMDQQKASKSEKKRDGKVNRCRAIFFHSPS